MKKLVVANWKMNPAALDRARAIAASSRKSAGALKKTTLVLCPPFVYLSELSKMKAKNFYLGAQDVFWQEEGSYTGEISPLMLKNLGVKYVIVGHSERRRHLKETDEMVNKKVKAVLRVGLKVILCVGEEKRDSGTEFLKFIKSEIGGALKGIPRKLLKNLIMAYEPIWAIGKKGEDADTPEDAVEMALYTRKCLVPFVGKEAAGKTPVLYGGSVDPKNAAGFLETGISGLLVGHESLAPGHFSEILKIADEVK